MRTLTQENYLKALFALSGESGEITVAGLSKKLGVKMPTVTSMMKRMARQKLVRYERYRPLRLTEKGEREALLIIRKHRLVEMFLVKKMRFGWEAVHELAEQLEHIQAPEFFNRMDELLGFPRIDPHGEPIPDRIGNLRALRTHPLSTCKAGETVRLCALGDASDDFLRFLNHRGLRLGMRMQVESTEPYDGSVIVSYGRRRAETLTHAVCENLLVERA
jgi:DtxR family Mn-dependent transcriptional regulator